MDILSEKISRQPEHRPLYKDVEILDPQRAYGFIFQTEPYTTDPVKIVGRTFSDYLTSGIVQKVGSIESALELLGDPKINARNVDTIAFRNRQKPPIAVMESLFDRSNPVAIELTNVKQTQELWKSLRENNDLTESGKFAGSLLLSTTLSFDLLRNKNAYKGSIAIGVVEQETNRPLGIVFAPEGMLDFEFTDHRTGRKRKLTETVASKNQVLSPVGVEI